MYRALGTSAFLAIALAMPVQPQEHFLGKVLGFFPVAQTAIKLAEHLAPVAFDQFREGGAQLKTIVAMLIGLVKSPEFLRGLDDNERKQVARR